jgi:hypothetical protein
MKALVFFMFEFGSVLKLYKFNIRRKLEVYEITRRVIQFVPLERNNLDH